MLGHEGSDSALAKATSAPHCVASSLEPHGDEVLDEASAHCVKQCVLDGEAVAEHARELPFSEHERVAASAISLAEGRVPLSAVPLMAMAVSLVRLLTSGKVPASGVPLIAMFCRLDGRVASAVKPAPLTYRDCRPARVGSVPVSSPTSRRDRLVKAGKLHVDGAVTDLIPRSVRLCSAGSDEMASSAPPKQLVMRVQSMRSDVSDVQLAMPAGRLLTAVVLPTGDGS